MANRSEVPKSGGTLPERASRFLRDFNLAVGAVALVGAVVAPPILAPALGVYAGWNAAQAGGFELARRHFAKKRQSKS